MLPWTLHINEKKCIYMSKTQKIALTTNCYVLYICIHKWYTNTHTYILHTHTHICIYNILIHTRTLLWRCLCLYSAYTCLKLQKMLQQQTVMYFTYAYINVIHTYIHTYIYIHIYYIRIHTD